MIRQWTWVGLAAALVSTSPSSVRSDASPAVALLHARVFVGNGRVLDGRPVSLEMPESRLFEIYRNRPPKESQ